ncbi:hypothetical protein ACF3DV_03140 [Chlorogloeopsis fritschii PCC 9212]|uniref:Uncharacterized protein n=1 Tax=Chlorogloeopsis fritschii PCC 6912 TaxID=211165 RepID=A0A3S0XN08_CHLFR|nr:hypothetical protein [Chlorogloeopsis fritschii]RUR73771.1 hypothetical protein PCC6912_55480 [Chlorogloeopsis fritschii PCC 6912]
MTQANILELARQGDAKAIASLMNSQLQLKNVTVKVNFKNTQLEIKFQSTQVPEQENLVKYVRQEIMGLKTVCIKNVKVYGFQEGKLAPLWSQELNIEVPLNLSSSKKCLLNTNCKIQKDYQNILKNKFLEFSLLTDKKTLLKILLLLAISIFIAGESRLFSSKKKCILHNHTTSKYIHMENCK